MRRQTARLAGALYDERRRAVDDTVIDTVSTLARVDTISQSYGVNTREDKITQSHGVNTGASRHEKPVVGCQH